MGGWSEGGATRYGDQPSADTLARTRQTGARQKSRVRWPRFGRFIPSEGAPLLCRGLVACNAAGPGNLSRTRSQAVRRDLALRRAAFGVTMCFLRRRNRDARHFGAA
jgi:hypothetical protein